MVNRGSRKICSESDLYILLGLLFYAFIAISTKSIRLNDFTIKSDWIETMAI